MTSRTIALTGGIGSGKSTVARLFEAKGARIIDADLIARELVTPGQPALEEITKTFGREFLLPDGTLNRKMLAAAIFINQQKRTSLEKILHPRIRDAFIKQLCQTKHAPITIYVAPLFYEAANTYPEISGVIVVWAPEEQCLNRIILRDQLSPEEALLRIRSQMPLDQKTSRADWVIQNDGSIEALLPQVERVFSTLVKPC